MDDYYKDHPTPYEEELARQLQQELEEAASSRDSTGQQLEIVLERIDLVNKLQVNWRWN